MNTYVPYIRTIEGAIERNNHVTFRWHAPLGPYRYEVALEGWPESKVFWQHEEGYSVGLAPIGESPSILSSLATADADQ